LFVCICNAITEKQVTRAVLDGAKNWRDVHNAHGYLPCCEKCECDITETINRIENTTSDMLDTASLPQAS